MKPDRRSIRPRDCAHRRWLMPAALLFAFLNAPLAAQDAGLEQIRADMSAGEYRAALTKLDKLLFPTSLDDAKRYELLMLKGECQLQLKNRMGAISTFKLAVKSAGDPVQLAAARANGVIVEKSSSGKFTPRGGSPAEAIDILPMESRKKAMLALRDDLQAQSKSKIDQALQGEELPPIEKAFVNVADAYFLELFATGEGGEGKATLQQLGSRAHELMEREITKSSRRIDYLMQVANSSTDVVTGRNTWSTTRMGLTSQQRNEVKSIGEYLNQIRQRATEYRRTAARVGGDEHKWDTLVADVSEAMIDAESLYNDR